MEKTEDDMKAEMESLRKRNKELITNLQEEILKKEALTE